MRVPGFTDNRCIGTPSRWLITHTLDSHTIQMDMWRRLWVLLLISLAKGDECQEQLGLFMSYFSTFPNMPLWALVMFDASTKIPEGILAGKFINMGNFDECINIRGIQTEFGNFDGKHCLASINSILPSSDISKLPVMKARDLRPAFLPEGRSAVQSSTGLIVSVCVPSSCTATHVEQFLPQVWSGLMGFNLSVIARNEDCHTAENPLHPSDWIAVMFFVIFATIVAVSTAYDLLERDEGKRVNLLLSFSLNTNGKRLLSTSTSKDSLGSLNGIRFITISWVIMGHFYTAQMSNMSNMTYFTEDNAYTWTRLYLTNATLSVDTFLLLSGLLVSYVFFRTVKSSNKFNLFMFYVHRYLRLTPSLAVIVLLTATVMKYISTGPMWDLAFGVVIDRCIRNWWSTLIYVNNYVHPQELCIGVTWYLAVDMQLYWLSPILLIPLWKKPRIGVWFGLILAVIGMIIPFVITYVNELGGSMAVLQADAAIEYYNKYYVASHCRFTPYVIGILLGYYLHNLKSANQNVKLTKAKVIVGWLCVAALLLTSLMSVHPLHQLTYKYNALDASFYNALGRPAWSLGVALLILLCSFGYGGIINSFLSWNFFIPLSKLTYGMYLTHGYVHQLQIYSARSSVFGGEIFLIPGYLGSLFFSVLTGLVLYLWFESPFLIIEKELLGKKKSPSMGKSNQEVLENTGAQPTNMQTETYDNQLNMNGNDHDITVKISEDKKSM